VYVVGTVADGVVVPVLVALVDIVNDGDAVEVCVWDELDVLEGVTDDVGESLASIVNVGVTVGEAVEEDDAVWLGLFVRVIVADTVREAEPLGVVSGEFDARRDWLRVKLEEADGLVATLAVTVCEGVSEMLGDAEGSMLLEAVMLEVTESVGLLLGNAVDGFP
jgi:hypothetical protein